MTDDILLRNDTGTITTLTLNTPKSLNALSDGMLAALKAQFEALAQDETIRVVILKGAGKVFCAGHDLKEMTAGRQAEDKGRAYFNDLFSRCAEIMLMIRKLPQPVIAQAHGIATAAGCQLVATCDLAVAADDTRFGVNGVNIGLFCSTPMVALSRNIHAKQAFEMLTTGQFIHADKAVSVGLINKAVPIDELDTATMDLATLLASKLNAAVRMGKEGFYNQIEMPIEEAYAYTGAVMAENMMLRDTAEGVSAFLEKRKPDWHQG